MISPQARVTLSPIACSCSLHVWITARLRHRDERLAAGNVDRHRYRDGQGDHPTYGQGLGQIMVVENRLARGLGLAETVQSTKLACEFRVFPDVLRLFDLRTWRNGK